MGKGTIFWADDTSSTGDILVGADGAYSGVRQNMYKKVGEKGDLPKSDLEGFSVGYTIIVGVIDPVDPEKYPILKKDLASFNQIIYNGDSNCYVLTLPNNKISWGFGIQLPESKSKEMNSDNSEWLAEESESIL
ncbi:hypothetical protein BGZ76_001230 [Entomortierella beljakovae]|nr:hypothetical protein BGZ76_001230 [Entomortierella beljakovae]